MNYLDDFPHQLKKNMVIQATSLITPETICVYILQINRLS